MYHVIVVPFFRFGVKKVANFRDFLRKNGKKIKKKNRKIFVFMRIYIKIMSLYILK